MKLQMKELRLLCLMIVAAMSMFVTSCKNKDKDPDSIVGDVSKPAWTEPENYDYSSSMTAIVTVDMTTAYTAAQLNEVGYQSSDNDVLAAFCGNTCLGLGEFDKDHNVYWLYISAPDSGDQVTLMYYSAVLRHIYAAEPFQYQSDGNRGTIEQPYTPKWVLSK